MKTPVQTLPPSSDDQFKTQLDKRYNIDRIFQAISWIATFSGIVVLAILIIGILSQGLPTLSFDFLTSPPSRQPERAGVWPAFLGSIFLVLITGAVSFPIGVGSGIFLQEFARENKWAKVIEVNISNLAAVPSIIYGLLGLFVFARLLIGITGGRSILSGGLTLALLILPVIIVATRESLKAVPDSIRQAGLALGATEWQTVRTHVLPQAIPGIMTGTILALSRAIGETAPIIAVGAAAFVPFAPEFSIEGLQEPAFTAMPIQIFNWVSRPQEEFHTIAASAIIILMIVLLAMNATAIFMRNRFQNSR
ncbi:MAG: phosphate ABC transporter permease PstA [Leptolyngbya sp. SIO1E4]|nr:phosphate ABC transporter permease PstA [Leptolyngbya sp. SIO1E4]